MKCPKCGYIGFEAVDRCRNCGYEFALAVSAPQRDDLEMRSATDPIGPLADLSLKVAPPSSTRRRTPAGKEIDLDRIIGAPDLSAGASAKVETPADLPLFEADAPAEIDAPLISPPSTPRKPLAVRRMTVPVARREERSSTPSDRMNLELPLPADASPVEVSRPSGRLKGDTTSGTDEDAVDSARPLPRLSAAIIDTVLLAAIDGLVLYFTLRLCSLTIADLRQLPLAPFLGFLLLLNGGYLVAFTAAGGQTIGKMAFGLKVVGPGDSTVPVATATLRSAASLVSTLCLGAGLVPALFGGRALHDRLAGTRVVHITL